LQGAYWLASQYCYASRQQGCLNSSLRPCIAYRQTRPNREIISRTFPVWWHQGKDMAAFHAGITTVLLPERNRKELDDIPEDSRQQRRFVWLRTVDDAIRAAISSFA
jgi:ATP-dependent Lon protease